MTIARVNHTATLLPNGTVLVAGGYTNLVQTPLASAEIYNPATEIWTAEVHWSEAALSSMAIAYCSLGPVRNSIRIWKNPSIHRYPGRRLYPDNVH
jgi:Galactose oxidase, central domain